MTDLARALRPYTILTLLCAALFLPGLASMPPTDRDESRFMQATKQMLETGDVVNIRVQAEPRNKKPVGIHWLQYASVKYLSGGDYLAVWAYRLPSALSAWIAVLAIFAFGRRMFSPLHGFVAAALTASCLLLVIEAHLAKTDAALLATVVLAQSALARFYLERNKSPPPLHVAFIFWTAIGLGVLIKGPVTPAIAALTAITLVIADKNWRWLSGLHPEVGIPLALTFVLPWYLAIAISGNPDFFQTAFFEDVWPKLTGGQEGHGAPPGVHTLLSPLTLWPASLFILPALPWAWKRRGEPAVRFLLAWAAGTWLLFELIPTKLPHYTLPAVPALALMAAASTSDIAHRTGNTLKIFVAVWSLFGVALGGALIWAARTYDGPVALTALATVFVLGPTVWAIYSIWRKAELPAPQPFVLSAIGFSVMVFAGALPNFHQFGLSPRLQAAVQTYAPKASQIALSRYHEPSAVFLLGTDTLLTNTDGIARHLQSAPGALAGIAEDELDQIRQRLRESGFHINEIERIAGYNYSKGRPETIVLIETAEDPRSDDH